MMVCCITGQDFGQLYSCQWRWQVVGRLSDPVSVGTCVYLWCKFCNVIVLGGCAVAAWILWVALQHTASMQALQHTASMQALKSCR